EVDAVAHVDAVTSAAGVVTTPEVAAVAHVNAVAEVLAVAHVDAVAEVLGFDEVTAKQASANVAKIKSLTWLLANNSQVYFDAKKYYLNRKEDSNHNNKPIKLVVENDYFRNVLIDHGFDFIKED
ncbi:MAG: hypothetical protein KAG14_00250, partial [Mycoplasmataceae bacterium]|nr:hypothetical protein [Mycoplasmataceae bacterium]